MLKTFVGFKGACAFAEIGDIRFVILAANQRQLETLWLHIMQIPLDPSGVKKAVLIEANLLPDKKGKRTDTEPTP